MEHVQNEGRQSMRYPFYAIIIVSPLFYHFVDPGAINPFLFTFVALLLFLLFIFVSIIERNLFIIAIVIGLFWASSLLVWMYRIGPSTKLIGEIILLAAIHMLIQITLTYLVVHLYQKLRRIITSNKETAPSQ